MRKGGAKFCVGNYLFSQIWDLIIQEKNYMYNAKKVNILIPIGLQKDCRKPVKKEHTVELFLVLDIKDRKNIYKI